MDNTFTLQNLVLLSIVFILLILCVLSYIKQRNTLTVLKTKEEAFKKEFSQLENAYTYEKEQHYLSKNKIEELQNKIEENIRIATNNASQLALTREQIQEFKHRETKFNTKIETIEDDKIQLLAENAELKTNIKNSEMLLKVQKQEFIELQEKSKLEFEQIANKILEEKSEKFTLVNQTNLKSILEPFQEKISDLKNKVHQTYDKESKERFSLGEKVKELAELNQQISQEAKRLTKALKGESKTQGRWGEMILESILEKSGLEKGKQYFLEQELKDADNKALHSEFSGKKMRPDAIVVFPDQRNVIIDSKVSLTAYAELIDQNDSEIYQQKLKKHLDSIKNHVLQLSQKGYDDYQNTLDFVMMFIPSEPAYITAMQADANLWNFAYEKRILLLNPSNLITSLKLVADLWKREYQSRNAIEIAERGAKLYDKFVGFIENMEKIGKSLDQTHNTYKEAYKQLCTGNDNLVLQTDKLKNLGLKTKKTLPSGIVTKSTLHTD